jgi:rhodanese-related sulfurtransferase
LKRGLTPLNVTEFEKTINNESVLILDCRRAEEFANGFIPDSINIGLESNFAMWVGELVSDIKQKIVLVCPEGKEEEAIIRLARVGYDHAIGYLEGGFEAWKSASRPFETSERITAKSFSEQFDKENSIVVDVRKVSEFESEHIENAINIPLNQLEKNIREIPTKQFYLHCAGGYRSMIAASILKKYGIENFVDIEGGFTEIQKTSVPVTEYACPSTFL